MSTTGHEPETRTGLEESAVRRGQERLHALLREAAEREATDLHLKPLRPPLLRVGGKLVPTSEPALTPGDLECLIEGLPIQPPGREARREERVEEGGGQPGRTGTHDRNPFFAARKRLRTDVAVIAGKTFHLAHVDRAVEFDAVARLHARRRAGPAANRRKRCGLGR